MKRNILLRVGLMGLISGGLSCLLSSCMFAQPAVPVDTGENDSEEINSNQTSYQPGPTGRAFGPENTATETSPVSYSVSSAAPTDTRVSANAPGPYVASTAAVDLNATVHRVVYGDSIYNIAKRYHIRQEDLRVWNNLDSDVISIGQVLKIKGPAGSAANAPAPAESNVSAPVVHYAPSTQETKINKPVATSPRAPQPVTVQNTSKAARVIGGITWIQPAQGRLVERFSPRSKGINIVGSLGTPVVAVADGKVIYSNMLAGYGNLVILQHSEQYLSAYANNQSNLVKEGDRVKRGQKIATMGKTDAPRVQLHFEVRQNGQAVDPLRFIPGY